MRSALVLSSVAARGVSLACFPTAKALAGLCEPCDVARGEFCEAGLRCFNERCARFCCDDADCGGGTCERRFSSDVGVCVAAEGGTSSTSSTSSTTSSGSGGGAATTSAASSVGGA